MIAGPLLALIFVSIAVWLLMRKYNAVAILLFGGVIMQLVAYFLLGKLPKLKQPTNLAYFDFIQYISEALADTNAGVGLVIMIISGFVAYMDKIGASDALVSAAMKPLHALKKYPYVLASLVLPLGQFLFVSIPSAAGLGLLLMASVFPILVSLGVSRLSAVSLITATTAFGIGPASAIALSAASVIEMDITGYFFQYQIPKVIPLSIVLTISYYFVNRYFDKKNNLVKPEEIGVHQTKDKKDSAPAIYAILPILPLVLLLVFSDFVNLFEPAIKLDTNAAMLIGLFTALLFEFFRIKDAKKVIHSLDIFWNGMADIFKSVVVLIIAADIFSKGLIALGFIDGLVSISQGLGFGSVGIGIVMTVMIFMASILMGSGNAAFFAFGPLVPKIATQLGADAVTIILPMSLAASMGRTVSPIAGVLVATASIAKVTPLDVVKRNAIPFGIGFVLMLLFNYL